MAVEEPLEIRVDGRALAVTMRTPGHDEELALGFLYGEGLIDGPREAGPTEDFAANTVRVDGPLIRDPGTRRFYTTSSCGVCGKGALEEVAVHSRAADRGPGRRPIAGGSASGASGAADVRAHRGASRHGAIRLRRCAARRTRGRRATQRDGQGHRTGAARRAGPARDRILCVSGRLSFELVQKAAVAGAPILVGVGAPSSLAISLARGARDDAVWVCSAGHDERVRRSGADQLIETARTV